MVTYNLGMGASVHHVQADHPDRLVARVVEVDSPGGSMATARRSVLGKEVAVVIVFLVQADHSDRAMGGANGGIRPILPVAFSQMEEFDDRSRTLLLWIAPS